nr:ComEC/Rec2 family competence protein [Bacillus altitudinis]
MCKALIFGDRDLIDPDTLRDYQMLGIIHLLAISGLHVQTLLACLFWCLLRAGVTRETARILLLSFLPVYACLTGAAPSVLRACLMAGIYLVITSLAKRNETAFCGRVKCSVLAFISHSTTLYI